jgi:hypothetical protein
MDEIVIYIAIELLERKESAKLFTEKYLNGFAEVNEYYEYPQFRGKTEFETVDYREMILFVLKREGRKYRFYFKNEANRETPFAMMFFNEDGSLFLGIEVHSDYQSKYEDKLRNDFKSSMIMICNNILPPNNLVDFKLAI